MYSDNQSLAKIYHLGESQKACIFKKNNKEISIF